MPLRLLRTPRLLWAGMLVAPALGEFGLLRPRSALFARAPDPVPLTGIVNYPRLTSAAASGFVAEGTAIPVRQHALETMVLSPFKAAGIMVATSELVNRADRFSESFVMGTLSDDISLGSDKVSIGQRRSGRHIASGHFS